VKHYYNSHCSVHQQAPVPHVVAAIKLPLAESGGQPPLGLNKDPALLCLTSLSSGEDGDAP